MNAARRSIVEHLVESGMSPKEAYEESKEREWMKEWIKISVRDPGFEKKPKPKSQMKWSARLRHYRQLRALEMAKLLAKRKSDE